MTEAQQVQGQPTPEVNVTQEAQGFTQEDVNKIVGSRAKEARQAAINDLLEKTGAESIDDVLAAYTEYSEIQEAVTTEADRAEKAREKAEAKAKQAEERYTSTLREYALRDALRDSGINPGRIPQALKIADSQALEIDADGNVSGVEDVVEAVKEASPEWFGTTEDRRPVRSPDATRQHAPRNDTYEGQMGGFLSQLLNAP